MPLTYRVRRGRLQVAPGVFRVSGELYPEAVAMYRLLQWVHTGHLEEVTVSQAELEAAVERYCPDRRAEILRLVAQSPKGEGAPIPRGLGRGPSADERVATRRRWALELDAGPLVGPVPRRTRGRRRRP